MNEHWKGTKGKPRDLQALLARARDIDLRLEPFPESPEPLRRRPPRMVLLWVLSTPLLIGALTALAAGRLDGFAGDAAAWGLVTWSILLTRQGFADLGAGRERRFSRRWRLPLRNLAAGLLGVGTAVAAGLGAGHGLLQSLAFGAVAVFGYHLAYGLESMVVGQRLPAGGRAARAVADALAEAETRLINIEQAAAAIGNPELRLRLHRIAGQGRAMLEQNFRNVLVTIEDQFASQRERLRQADVLDLDVQIEVLKKQLEQEGIR